MIYVALVTPNQTLLMYLSVNWQVCLYCICVPHLLDIPILHPFQSYLIPCWLYVTHFPINTRQQIEDMYRDIKNNHICMKTILNYLLSRNYYIGVHIWNKYNVEQTMKGGGWQQGPLDNVRKVSSWEGEEVATTPISKGYFSVIPGQDRVTDLVL